MWRTILSIPAGQEETKSKPDVFTNCGRVCAYEAVVDQRALAPLLMITKPVTCSPGFAKPAAEAAVQVPASVLPGVTAEVGAKTPVCPTPPQDMLHEAVAEAAELPVLVRTTSHASAGGAPPSDAHDCALAWICAVPVVTPDLVYSVSVVTRVEVVVWTRVEVSTTVREDGPPLTYVVMNTRPAPATSPTMRRAAPVT